MTARKKKAGTNGVASQEHVTTHEEDPLLTLSEVARQIGKTRPTVARWCKDGLLPFQKMPNGIEHVRQSHVNRLLQVSETITARVEGKPNA